MSVRERCTTCAQWVSGDVSCIQCGDTGWICYDQPTLRERARQGLLKFVYALDELFTQSIWLPWWVIAGAVVLGIGAAVIGGLTR